MRLRQPAVPVKELRKAMDLSDVWKGGDKHKALLVRLEHRIADAEQPWQPVDAFVNWFFERTPERLWSNPDHSLTRFARVWNICWRTISAFRPPDPKWNDMSVPRWELIKCRLGGHKPGPIYYNPGGMEPDGRCAGCHELIA